MKAIASVSMLVASLFMAGCVGPTYAEKTDLSVLELGASRDQVETVLGKPTKIKSGNRTQVATYGYNKGGLVTPDYGHLTLHATLLFPFTLAEMQQNWNRQRGHLEVTYDSNQKVAWYRSTDKPWLEIWSMANRDGYEGVPTCKMTYSEIMHLSIEAQTAMYYQCHDVMWACILAHLKNRSAQARLASQYHGGHEPFERDPIRAYVFYGLAGQESSKESIAAHLTPEQVSEAERLMTEWEPNPVECDIQTTGTSD